MNLLCQRRRMHRGQSRGQATQKGFALFTMIVIVIVVGIIAMSSMSMTEKMEVLAGSSIQRNRAMQSAEGGLINAENGTAAFIEKRVFSTADGESGLFSRDSVDSLWWRDLSFSNASSQEDANYPGSISPPRRIVEEIGSYVSDGGSGIVSLDRGGASYGQKTSSGKEVVLFRLQSIGYGSTETSQAVLESLYVRNQ